MKRIAINVALVGLFVAAAVSACESQTEVVRVIKNFNGGGGSGDLSGAAGDTGIGTGLAGTGVPPAGAAGTGSVSGAAGSSPTGAAGTTGAAGSSPSGGAGTQGAAGSIGPTGVAGTTGAAGAQGAAGTGIQNPPDAGAGMDAPTMTGPINVLVFNHTSGYGHQSRMTAIPLLKTAAMANNINLDLQYAHTAVVAEGTNDSATPPNLTAFVPGGLDKYDVVFFLNTTGNIFQGTDEKVHQQALQDYMEKRHGGFVGTHSATDTYDDGWQWYQDFVGSIYNGHSTGVVPGSARYNDGVNNHPVLTMSMTPNPWSRSEEWYVFRRDVRGLPEITVLLLANAPGPTGATSERPIAWVHNVPGGGRLFYSAFGHDVKAFQEASFMNQIMTGIKWAAHRIN